MEDEKRFKLQMKQAERGHRKASSVERGGAGDKVGAEQGSTGDE